MKRQFFVCLSPLVLGSPLWFAQTAHAQTQTELPAEPLMTLMIRDFGPRSFDYAYGPNWKIGENITTDGDGVKINTNESGGAGLVLNGKNLNPQGQTHLAIRAKLLEGNAAGKLQININGPGANKSVSLDLSKLSTTYQTVLLPLPDGKFDNVAQIQFQGTNWGGGEAVKLVIDCIGTTSSDAATNTLALEKAKEAAKTTPGSGPPAKDKPSVAAWGYYPQFPEAWMQFHQSYLERTKQGREKKDINIVFLGDSITQGWGEGGKELWNRKYKPLGAVNYGIGGDSTRQVLWRIQNGELDGIAPKLIVLMIGTNNLYSDFNAGSDAEIAEGIKAVVALIQQKTPNSKILLLGLLPRENAWFSGRIAGINEQIARLENGKNVRFLDMGPKFAVSPAKGEIDSRLYKGDRLHLVHAGYEMWDATMTPLFEALSK